MFTSSQRLQNSNYSKLTLHQPGNFLKKKHQKTHLKLGTAEFAILIRIDLFKELPLTNDGPSTVYISYRSMNFSLSFIWSIGVT